MCPTMSNTQLAEPVQDEIPGEAFKNHADSPSSPEFQAFGMQQPPHRQHEHSIPRPVKIKMMGRSPALVTCFFVLGARPLSFKSEQIKFLVAQVSLSHSVDCLIDFQLSTLLHLLPKCIIRVIVERDALRQPIHISSPPICHTQRPLARAVAFTWLNLAATFSPHSLSGQRRRHLWTHLRKELLVRFWFKY